VKISIITVCFNSEEFIRAAIESVISQTYSDIEYIIIDGGSTDNTLSIIDEYSDKIHQVISEPDRGIYDAMNKGIAMASGDIVATLNSDDLYAHSSVIERVADEFMKFETLDAIYGDLVYVEQVDTDKVVRFWKSASFQLGMFRKAWVPAHPTFFVRNEVYKKYNAFNLNYQIAADFELMYRLLEEKVITNSYLPEVLVKMRVGGTTNGSFSNIIEQNREILSVMKARDSNFSTVSWVFRKIFDRFLQYTKRP